MSSMVISAMSFHVIPCHSCYSMSFHVNHDKTVWHGFHVKFLWHGIPCQSGLFSEQMKQMIWHGAPCQGFSCHPCQISFGRFWQGNSMSFFPRDPNMRLWSGNGQKNKSEHHEHITVSKTEGKLKTISESNHGKRTQKQHARAKYKNDMQKRFPPTKKEKRRNPHFDMHPHSDVIIWFFASKVILKVHIGRSCLA